MKTAFITSTGRTGTAFLTRLFNEVVENSWSRHEPWPAFRRRARRLMHSPPTRYDCAYFKIPRVIAHRYSGKEWYVENNYQLFAAIPVIRRAFPEAKIIHMVRDGRDVVTSYLNRWRYITTEHLTPAHVPGDPAADPWTAWNPLQKLAWFWKTVHQHVRTQHPDLVIRYEDIFHGERQGVFQLLDLFGDLQYNRDGVIRLLDHPENASTQKFFPDYPDWPEYWKEQFWDIAGEEMARQGYARDEKTPAA